MTWFLAFLGILLSFGLKYWNKSKEGDFSSTYWWKDNHVELGLSCLVVLLIMILYNHPDTSINWDSVTTYLGGVFPGLEFVTLPIKLVLAGLIGFFSNDILYKLAKKKEKQGESKALQNG